jgi:hypothetical protein
MNPWIIGACLIIAALIVRYGPDEVVVHKAPVGVVTYYYPTDDNCEEE